MDTTFSPDERKILLQTAKDAINYALKYKKKFIPKLADYPEKLQKNGASFVTLEENKNLRGCIGTLEAHQPLIIDVAANAYYAAFSDPRFSPLHQSELEKISIHISILTQPKPLLFTSEEDLLAKIRPKIDGLIFVDKGLRGTFLPCVWETLPEPKIFLEQLKLKAGFPKDYWSDTVQIFYYTAEIVE
jgi:uncharacterized protein